MNCYDFDTSDYPMFSIGEAQHAVFSKPKRRIAEFKKGGAIQKSPNWIRGGQVLDAQVISSKPTSSAIVPRYNQAPPGVTPGNPPGSSGSYSQKGVGRMEGTGGFANVKAFIRKTKKGGLSLVKGGLRKVKAGGGAVLQAAKKNPRIAGSLAVGAAAGAAAGGYAFVNRKKRRRQINRNKA